MGEENVPGDRQLHLGGVRTRCDVSQFALADSRDDVETTAKVLAQQHDLVRREREVSLGGEDHHAAIEVPLEFALSGGEREIQLRAMELDSQGQPEWVTRTLRVNIPRGVRPGQYIRLAGQGLPGHGGEPAGDLYLEVRIAPHPLYRVDGRDLLMTLPVTPSEAALGAEVEVPTVDGSEMLTIAAGAQSGDVITLRGRGLPHLGETRRGDQHVRLQLWTPTQLTEEQEELFRRLAEVEGVPPVMDGRNRGGFWNRVKEAFTA